MLLSKKKENPLKVQEPVCARAVAALGWLSRHRRAQLDQAGGRSGPRGAPVPARVQPLPAGRRRLRPQPRVPGGARAALSGCGARSPPPSQRPAAGPSAPAGAATGAPGPSSRPGRSIPRARQRRRCPRRPPARPPRPAPAPYRAPALAAGRASMEASRRAAAEGKAGGRRAGLALLLLLLPGGRRSHLAWCVQSGGSRRSLGACSGRAGPGRAGRRGRPRR